MLLIAEIILTIFAWRNGWKWYALIPLGICMVIGFLIGLIVGMFGGTLPALSPVLIFDLLAIVALIVMVCKKPKPESEEK
jgi:uncharacterized membrane protein YfcA